MHDAPSERLDLRERLLQVPDGEVGKSSGVPWAAAAEVHAHRRARPARLPSLPLALRAVLQRTPQQAAPERPRPLGVVRRELDQLEPGADDLSDCRERPGRR